MGLDAADDPRVEGRRPVFLADDVERMSAERAVPKPGVVVGRKGRTGHECAGGGLAVPKHGDAPTHERIVEQPRDRRPGRHPFTPPAASPLTNCRWKTTKIRITGSTAITDAAKTKPQLVAC